MEFTLPFLLLLTANEIVLSVSDSGQRQLEWWQTGVIYQIFPRSFKDSDGNGVGDLKGIEEKAEYLKDLGVSSVWLSPVFESPMVDFGYDISNYYEIADVFGNLNDFKSLKNKLDSLGIKIILDFVPNHTSDQHDWFKQSVNKISPYTDYYVWKDPVSWNGTTPVPPNNWVSLFNGPAWKYNEVRKQFYLHQFAEQQPDLNFRCSHLLKEMEEIILYWLEQGVDGFRMDSVAYVLEHPDFPNEPINEKFSSDVQSHESLLHNYSKNWPENFNLMRQFEELVEGFSKKDGKQRIVIHEAYTDLENTMKFYGIQPGRHMPFNFLLITDVDEHSNAARFTEVIQNWLKNMPESGWPNWVIGNHDNSRVATRFGEELADGMNMVNLLLPGTAITYNGEEIAMTDGRVRWDQTLDPGALNAGIQHFRKFSRDPERTPFPWDDSTNGGFTSNTKPWLPMNSNYWKLNLEAQRNSKKSHYHVYKRLVELRAHPTMQYGNLKVHVLTEWVLMLIRELKNEDCFVIVVNLGSEEEIVNFDKLELSEYFTVHTSSINSEYEIGTTLLTKNPGFKMRPKSSLVLTTGQIQHLTNGISFTSSVLSYLEPLFFLTFRYIA